MIPSEKELLEFIRKKDLVNLSMIARFFEIKNTTASDVINDLEKRKLVKVKKFGGSKVVLIA